MPLAHTRDPISTAAQTIAAAGTTQSPQIGLPDGIDWVGVQINTSAIGGTSPNITYSVEWSMDGTTWATGDPVDTFTAVTAVGVKIARFNVRAPLMRVKAVTTGTGPTATWTPTVYYR